DLLDELAHLGGGGLRLLALDADQRSLVLLVGKPDFRKTAGEQGDADHGQEQRHICAEQPPPGLRRPVCRRAGALFIRIPHGSALDLTTGNGGKLRPNASTMFRVMISKESQWLIPIPHE